MRIRLTPFFPRLVTQLVVASAFLVSCNQYKPSSYRNQVSSTPGIATNSNSTPVTLTDISLVVANTKLATLGGNLTARINYGGQTINQEFTPSGTQSELKALKLPSGAGGVMTLEILQGETVKFIAKRGNTAVQAGSRVVFDDCLILRAPWVGTVNEGSCEWNITEVN